MKNSPKTPSTSAPYVNTPTMNRARLTGPVVGLTLLTLGLVACGGSTPSIPAPVTPAASAGGKGDVVAGRNPDMLLVPFSYDGTNHDWSDPASALTIQGLNLSSGNNDLSAQAWSSASSGWGPVEKNRSNGEYNGGDGNTLTLQGKTYTTGLGVHASSDITYDVNGQCSGFQSDMGVDDEVRSLGSVTFEIWADGTRLYDSGVMTGSSATKFASVDLTGKNQLRLVVTGGGDNINYDHADWAGATLLGCSGSNTTWTTVASESGTFTLQARSTVRYGTGQSWTQKDLDAGTYACSNDTFGTDPAYGVGKQCQVSSAGAAAAPSNASSAYSGPLVITKGGTYSGNWESQNPDVPVISVQTSEPVIIENSNLRGKGNIIAGFGSRITIRNVNAYGLNPNIYGRIVGKFINLEEFKNIVIENNYIEGTSGIYVRAYKGDPNAGETIKILRNKVLNTDGRQSDGNGGFTTTRNITQTVFFNTVQRIPGAEIAWNQVINEPGKSLTEENINMYMSSGTASSPILIHDNYIQGAYNAAPWSEKSYAGGGILLGDGATSNPDDAGHARVYNNQIVNASNHSLSITGGVDNQIYNNRAIYSGRLPDGRIIAHGTTVGSVIWDSANQGKYNPPTFYNNVMSNNYFAINNLNSDGSSAYASPWWTPDCGNYNTSCVNNVNGGRGTQDMEKQEFQNWLSKSSSAGVKVGPTN